MSTAGLSLSLDFEANRTRWSQVRLLGGTPTDAPLEQARWVGAWEYLCRTYRKAMEAYVGRLLGKTGVVAKGEAEDIVQGFLLECLDKSFLLKADPRIGKFRHFIRGCLKRYTYNYVTARNTQRRRPKRPIVALEAVVGGVEADAGDDEFSKDWASCMMRSALPRVERRSEPNARLLRVLMDDPTLDPDELAARTDIPRHQVPVRTHRAKRMLAEELWSEIKETVRSDAEFEEERVELLPFLSRYLTESDAPSLFGGGTPS